MRALLLVTLLACRSSSSVNDLPPEAWGTTDYVAAGLPSIDHTWTIDEHEAAGAALAKAVEGHRERLPHLGGAKSGAVFARIAEPTPTARDVVLDPKTDFIVHARRFETTNLISKLYTVDPLAAATADYLALYGVLLHETVELDRTADPFLALYPAGDPTREARLGGLATMRRGWGEMLLGGLMICADIRVAEPVRIALAKQIAAVLPVVFAKLEPTAQQSIRGQLTTLRSSTAFAAVLPAQP